MGFQSTTTVGDAVFLGVTTHENAKPKIRLRNDSTGDEVQVDDTIEALAPWLAQGFQKMVKE